MMEPFDTNRWTGIAGVALLAVGIGVLTEQPGAILAGVVATAYAAAARSGDAPAPALGLSRTLDRSNPEEDDAVEVTVRVENAGETLADLRIVDGVPPGLEVVDGSPRHATALRAGEVETFSYSVRAVRGVHEWTAADVVTRSLSGAQERREVLESATTLRCVPELGTDVELPLRGLATRSVGRIETDVGGPGIEFHAVREYRRGDPVRRVDWNRLARTGERSTVELRRERAATVALVVDARREAYRAPNRETAHAVERSADAVGRTLTALLSAGDRVGLAALSPRECWIAPGSGRDHRERARELLADSPAFAPTPPEDYLPRRTAVDWLRGRLAEGTQIVLFSPVCDDVIVGIARRLDARGHLVTVVSPDPTGEGTPGRTLAAIARRNRLRRLRRAGLRVVDWGDEPLAGAIARARRGWSR